MRLSDKLIALKRVIVKFMIDQLNNSSQIVHVSVPKANIPTIAALPTSASISFVAEFPTISSP